MEAQEFELVLNDLETRVDRLRALYENWFRGYEKLEPQVARKDVERRVYGLRKELPRNTALRFRYHQLYQRYTTLANYWQRTAKQIEEGTHRLQIQRMRRRHGTRDDVDTAERETPSVAPPRSYELNLDESLSVNDLLDELEMDEVARAVDKPGPLVPSEPPPPKAPARAVGVFKPRRGRSSAPPARTWTLSEPPASAPPEPEARDNARQPAAPLPAGLPRSPLLGGALPPPPGLPGAKPPISAPAGGAAKAPTPLAAPKTAPGAPAPAPGGLPRPAAPPIAGAPKLPPPPTPGVAPKPVPPPQRAPVQSGDTKVGRPPPPANPMVASPDPHEQRLRRLYDEYAAARRKNNEGEVRYDALVTSIQKMMPELQKKHGGKQIDFEVVVKDGRVGLKPKAL